MPREFVEKRVLIGVQARSTSERFPGKVHEKIGGRRIIDMILDTAEDAIKFLSREKRQIRFDLALLCPEGDILCDMYSDRVPVIEGSEPDVLSRYIKASNLFNSDYVVRVTGDCPLLPDYVISKHIRSAVYGEMDYVANSHPEFRTAPDGWDCEIMSRRMMEWLSRNATTPEQREHVTIAIREKEENLPYSMKIGYVIEKLDNSSIKISVDTPEDLEAVRTEYHDVQTKMQLAQNSRPGVTVYRL